MRLHALTEALGAALDGTGPALALGDEGEGEGEGEVRADAGPGAAVILTTSGSTGHPKSVVLSREAIRSSVSQTARRIGEGRWLLALSPHRIAGLQVLARQLRSGTPPVALDSALRGSPFLADEFAAATARLGDAPRYTSLVPAQLHDLLASDAGRTALRSFDAVLVGGQATDAALASRAAGLGIRLVRSYGSTETAGGCVYDGVPLDDTLVRIVDGEVWIAGPSLADGYLGEPERSEAVFVREGGRRWYRTGDLGRIDEGVVRIEGRADNVIVSGGVNVSLDRVEAVVRAVPGFEGAVVVGAPHPRWGQAPVVASAGVSDAAAALDRLRTVVGEALGAPARPARVLAVGALPMLRSGKPDRRALAELAAAEAAAGS